MIAQRILYFTACAAALAVIIFTIEATGGLPSQLAHLYYIPVVGSALVLPRRVALAFAVLAGVAVSPVPDILHSALGTDLYYSDPAPWNLSPGGWLVRPIAFIAVSLLASRMAEEMGERTAVQSHVAALAGQLGSERVGKMRAEAARASKGRELNLLGDIEKMILQGASEVDSLHEIARLVAGFTGSAHAGIVIPEKDGTQWQAFYGYDNVGDAANRAEVHLPLGEGVSGQALLSGEVTVSRNVFRDRLYDDKMKDAAQRISYVSAAAAPIVLDGHVLGALVVDYDAERDFPPDELAMLQRFANQAAIAIAVARQRETLGRQSETGATVAKGNGKADSLSA